MSIKRNTNVRDLKFSMNVLPQMICLLRGFLKFELWMEIQSGFDEYEICTVPLMKKLPNWRIKFEYLNIKLFNKYLVCKYFRP